MRSMTIRYQLHRNFVHLEQLGEIGQSTCLKDGGRRGLQR